MSYAVNGFQNREIFSVNMLVFDEANFAAAEVTNQLSSKENVSVVGVTTATSLSVDTFTDLPSSSDSPSIFTIDALTNLPLSSNSAPL